MNMAVRPDISSAMEYGLNSKGSMVTGMAYAKLKQAKL